MAAEVLGEVGEALCAAGGRGLLVADENCPAELLAALPAGARVLTNRWDLHRAALARGHRSVFSDFELPAAGDLDLVAAPVAKERAVVHHLINRAALALAPGGRLLLWGGKQTGIKTCGQAAAAALGGATGLRKLGRDYLSLTGRGTAPLQPLADDDYTGLRPLAEPGFGLLFTKPGLFGWDRIDAGSALLAARLPALFARLGTPGRVLDLGCGYGLLAVAAHAAGAGDITATDNCAAALAACARNFAARAIAGRVEPSDCAAEIAARFDLVLCNPPHHRGFAADQQLTARFFRAAAAHLEPGGVAVFVAHRTVPAARLAAAAFGRCELLAGDDRFRVYLLQQPRTAAGVG
ncbi:MAG: methyltransferase [Pseudomonadota bacterium]